LVDTFEIRRNVHHVRIFNSKTIIKLCTKKYVDMMVYLVENFPLTLTLIPKEFEEFKRDVELKVEMSETMIKPAGKKTKFVYMQ